MTQDLKDYAEILVPLVVLLAITLIFKLMEKISDW